MHRPKSYFVGARQKPGAVVFGLHAIDGVADHEICSQTVVAYTDSPLDMDDEDRDSIRSFLRVLEAADEIYITHTDDIDLLKKFSGGIFELLVVESKIKHTNTLVSEIAEDMESQSLDFDFLTADVRAGAKASADIIHELKRKRRKENAN